jgi:hypothetical protein
MRPFKMWHPVLAVLLVFIIYVDVAAAAGPFDIFACGQRAVFPTWLWTPTHLVFQNFDKRPTFLRIQAWLRPDETISLGSLATVDKSWRFGGVPVYVTNDGCQGAVRVGSY